MPGCVICFAAVDRVHLTAITFIFHLISIAQHILAATALASIICAPLKSAQLGFVDCLPKELVR